MKVQEHFESNRYGSLNTLNTTIKRHVAVHYDGESPIYYVLFNMLNSMIGAGVVGLPYIFHSGLFTSVIIMILFAFISSYSLILLIISGKICGIDNYEDLAKHCFGLTGYFIVSLSMFLLDAITIISNLMILKMCISDILAYWDYQNETFVLILFCIFVIFPWCLPRDIAKIETISECSFVSSIIITILIIYEWIQQSKSHHTLYIANGVNWFIEYNAIPQSLGIIAFLFVCQDAAFLMYATLKNPTVKRWGILSSWTCFTALILFIFFGVFGYLLFGKTLQGNILNNFPATNIFAVIVRIIFCFTAGLTYPVCFFVVRHVCYTTYYYKENGKIKHASFVSSLCFTIPIFVISIILAIYINNLGFIMSLAGSLPTVILVFIMPSMCYLKCKYNIHGIQLNRKTLSAIILFLIGIIILIFSTTITIIQQL